MMGDDAPGDELNVAWKSGMHLGCLLFCHQGDVADPQFGAQRACSTTEPPAKAWGAHVARHRVHALYSGTMFPASYRNARSSPSTAHGTGRRRSGDRVTVARTDGRRVDEL